MVDRTITSADASFVISSSDFALAATILEGYGADAAFAAENQDTAELVLGVDGRMSAGWVPRMYPQVITLQADSPSLFIMEGIVAAQDAGRTVFRLNGVINLPGNKFSYTMTRGVLSSGSPMPTAQRVLKERTFTITWESILPVPIG
uniref:Tail protein n=4 Tax=unclassified bacterial viruses TaxID=12333 RepID=A0AAU6W2J3_9VIRU